MHNIYEIIFVIEPTVSIDDLKVHLDQFLDIVKKKNGSNLAINIIQQKKLAWMRKKYKYGYLIYHRYVSSPDTVNEYEMDLKSLETCILWQTILIDRDVDKNKFLELDSINEYNIIADSEEYNVMKDMM